MLKISKIKLIAFFSLIGCINQAQTNLVPNGRFENYTQCPNSIGQTDYATGWTALTNTPDYFNSCSTNTNCGVPSNLIGWQPAASGNAFQGFAVYSSPITNYREIIGAQLTNSLSIGQKYYIKFKLNLTLDYTSNTAADKTGIRFSTVQHNSVTALPPINNFAHIYVTSPITDTMNWTTVFKSFVADSNYRFIEVGNFFDDANTIKSIQWAQASNTSYYYFDELCVSSDSLFSLNYTTNISQLEQKNAFKIFPNPNSNGVLFFSKNLENAVVTLFDLFGNKACSYKINFSNQLRLNLTEGLYFIKISSSEINVIEKLIIKN